MKSFSPVLLAAGLVSAGSAHADIPTADAALLTERAQTSSTTVKLVPITTQRKDANQGVNCAVTTGKKANVSDPTVKPQAGAGARTIQTYAPDMPATPAPDARGGTLSGQTLFKSTGDVVGGLDASRSTLGAAGAAFRSSGQQVGTGPTVMGALDMNSAARLSNNLAWNGAIGSANLWVTALNALNLARSSDASRASLGMQAAPAPSGTRLSVPACPVGSLGSGTAADPCRSATGTCSSATATAGSCTMSRFVDQDGNVLLVLLPAGSAPDANAGTPPLSLAHVIAALAARSANAP